MTFVVSSASANICSEARKRRDEDEEDAKNKTIHKPIYNNGYDVRKGYYLNKYDIEIKEKDTNKKFGSIGHNEHKKSAKELLTFCNSIQQRLDLLPFQVLFFPQYDPPFITDFRDYRIKEGIKFDFDGINKIFINFLEDKKNESYFTGGFYFVFNIFQDDGTNIRRRFIVDTEFLESILASLELFIFNILNDFIFKKELNLFENLKSDIGTYFYFKRDLSKYPYQTLIEKSKLSIFQRIKKTIEKYVIFK